MTETRLDLNWHNRLNLFFEFLIQKGSGIDWLVQMLWHYKVIRCDYKKTFEAFFPYFQTITEAICIRRMWIELFKLKILWDRNMITGLQGLKCIWTPCISGLLSVWSSVAFRCIHSRIVLFFYWVESDVNRNLASYCPATALSTIYLVWQAEIKWMFPFFPLLRYIYIYIY